MTFRVHERTGFQDFLELFLVLENHHYSSFTLQNFPTSNVINHTIKTGMIILEPNLQLKLKFKPVMFAENYSKMFSKQSLVSV